MKPFASAPNCNTPRRLTLGVVVLGAIALLVGGGCQHVRQRCGLFGSHRSAQNRQSYRRVANAGYCETRWVSFTPTTAPHYVEPATSELIEHAPSALIEQSDGEPLESPPLPQPLLADEALLDSKSWSTQPPQDVEVSEILEDTEPLMSVEDFDTTQE